MCRSYNPVSMGSALCANSGVPSLAWEAPSIWRSWRMDTYMDVKDKDFTTAERSANVPRRSTCRSFHHLQSNSIAGSHYASYCT